MMRQFGPPHRSNLVADLEDEITAKTHALIDALAGERETEVVSRFAHQLPVSIICKLMDIPHSDAARFHEWVAVIIGGFGTGNSQTEAMAATQSLAATSQTWQWVAAAAAERICSRVSSTIKVLRVVYPTQVSAPWLPYC